MTTLGRLILKCIAAPVLAVAGTGAGEGRAVSDDALPPLDVDAPPDKGVDAPPDKGADVPPDKSVDASPDKGSRTSSGKKSAGAIRMAKLLLALSSDVTATNDEAMRAFSTGSSSFALTALGVDALPDKGVDAPPDKSSRISPGKDSAGATRVARLLLALSLDVTATDDEAVRAFSTDSSSFAIPNVSSVTGPPKEVVCSARGLNGQGRILHPSVAAVKTGPNGRAHFSSSTRALAGLVAGWSSTRGVNGQGRVLHPSVAAVRTGPNGRAPFSSSTRALAGLAAGWTSLAKNEMQGFSSESSRTGRSHELQISGTLGGRTWAK